MINTASVAGLVGVRDRAAYCASKAAIIGLTRAMAVDKAQMNARQLLGRMGRPEEIAAAAVYLASAEAGFVHGSCFIIDGGMTAQ